jgi:hypothetical protein
MHTNYIIPTIDKEETKLLHFSQADVLFFIQSMGQRSRHRKRGIALGDLNHQKRKIVFQAVECAKQEETTIWSIKDGGLILKNNN